MFSYLFLVSVLNTTARLRGFLSWLLIFILTLTVLALLQYYEIIDNPALAGVWDRINDEETGEVIGTTLLLCGAGIFANPNDLARILVVGIALALYFFTETTQFVLKPILVIVACILMHALLLTQSRGGFLGLVVTLLVLSWLRPRLGPNANAGSTGSAHSDCGDQRSTDRSLDIRRNRPATHSPVE